MAPTGQDNQPLWDLSIANIQRVSGRWGGARAGERWQGWRGGGAGSPRSHGSQVKPGSQGLFSRGSRKEPMRVIWSRRAETVSADLGLGVTP